MQSYKVIQTVDEVTQLGSYLHDTGCVRAAVDIEGENNLHSYGIRVSLIQIFEGKRAFVIDALALSSKDALADLLQGSSWLKVMYDAGNDLLAFQHDLGFRPAPILDAAIAAQMLKKPGGLSALSPDGHSRSAKDRFQKANWMRRPLSADLLAYAVSDVLALPQIADDLLAELAQKKLLLEFLKKNWERQNVERSWDPFANYGRIPGYHHLKPDARRLARVLWYAREYYAKRFDLSPEMVASKQLLKRITDEHLRDAQAIVVLLNDGRKREPINLAAFAECLDKAWRDAPSQEITGR